jgi:hypothetical protein
VRRGFAILLLAGLAAGCSATDKTVQTPAPITLAGPLGYRPPSNPLTAQDAGKPTPLVPTPKLLCDAPGLTYLIGRPKTEIPVPADLSHRRVVCTHCPGNIDYQPTRTNILFNPATGLITAVKCG